MGRFLAELMLAEMGDRDPAMLGQEITSCVLARSPGAAPRLDRLGYAELLADELPTLLPLPRTTGRADLSRAR